MKSLVWSLVLALAGAWSVDAVLAVEADASPPARTVTVTTEVDAEGEPGTAVVVVDADGEQRQLVLERIEGEHAAEHPRGAVWIGEGVPGHLSADGADGNVHVLGNVAVHVAREAGGPWLGVQLGLPDEDLQTQLGELRGIVVLNVAEGSAAAEAGFEQYDVITAVNDERIGEQLGGLVERIRSFQVGDRVKFTVIREGQRRTLFATLGERPAEHANTWLYEFAPELELKDSVDARFRMLFKDDEGAWVLKNLDDVDGDMQGVFDLVMPGFDSRTMQVFVGDDGTRISTTVTQDGATINVVREGDGQIVVTRTQDGETTTQRYADEAALADADEQAYEIYKQIEAGTVVNGEIDFDFDVDVDVRKLHEALADQIQGNEKLQEAMERLHNMHLEAAPFKGRVFQALQGKATRRIVENPDGTIEVTIRKGGDELVLRYADADDLRERDPDTYDAYLDLLDAQFEE